MRKFQLLKYLMVIIMVLPLFYDYFGIFPGATKYVLDLFIVIYIVYSKQSLNKQSGFTRLYLCYIGVVGLITILSILIHNESIGFFVEEIRRLIIPLLLYYIVSDVFDSQEHASVHMHKFLAVIMIIQIPVTVVQTLFYSTFKSLDLFAANRYYLDAAAGTLGAGGHSYLGILIPLIFIYLYDFKVFKFSIPFIIPLLLINSGGGVILFGIVVGLLGLYSLLTGPVVHRVRIIAGMTLLIGILISLSQTQFVRQTFKRYVATYFFYQEHYIEGGKETFVGQAHKISRFNGYKFLEKRMDPYEYEHLFGLGFEFQENKGSKRPYSFKSDLNAIIAERGFLGLAAHGIFIILFLAYVYRTLKRNRYEQIFTKMLFFSTFFMAGFYNQTSRSAIIWFIIIYFLVVVEKPERYKQLSMYLGLIKKKARSRGRRKLPELHNRSSI